MYESDQACSCHPPARAARGSGTRFTTHGNFPRKHGFYNKFGALFTAYLVALPVLTAVTGNVSVTRRQIFIEAWSTALLIFAQLVFLILYNPYWHANKSFPFHTQTPQDLGIIAEIARATEVPQALSGQGVAGHAARRPRWTARAARFTTRPRG